jgi:hypothetical protein
MSVTWTLQVDPDVERWLNKEITLVEPRICDMCLQPSVTVRTVRWNAGLEVAVCAECRGDD